MESSYENPLAEDELDNTERHYYNSSHDDNTYDINSLKSEEETADIYHNNKSNSNCTSPNDIVQTELSSEKSQYLGKILSIIEQQMKNQNKIMEHLAKVTCNLNMLMESHVKNLEKQNKAIEKQLRATESHNGFLRRQESRRKCLNKFKLKDLQRS